MERIPPFEAVIIDSEDHDGEILRLTGEIDTATVPQLLKAIDHLTVLDPTGVIVDASQVTFIDSAGLHALITGKRLLHDQGCRLALVVSPQVRRVLELVFPEPLFAARVDTMEQAREVLGWKEASADVGWMPDEVRIRELHDRASRLAT